MPFPANAEAMRAEGYRFLNHAECSGCHAPIEWWLTRESRHIPMDLMPTPQSPAKAHWATCSKASQFKKKAVKEGSE
jgi:hypothetical protein